MDTTAYFALDTNALPWEQRTNSHLPAPIFRKVLHTDAETGVFFQIVRYPAGVINPSHTHPCAHAIYVLEGTLVTHKGRYAPGAFVWFPQGEVMEHGAGAEGDVTVLLVSNKPFSINYVEASAKP
jgi:quercetin dioxygenase-like cupin family protein